MPDPSPPAPHGARAPRSRTPAPGASAPARSTSAARRHAALAAPAVALAGVLVWQIVTAHGGTPDPTAIPHLGHGAVVADSAILVFREGLECILVLAAITAGLNDAHRIHRRPIAAGAGVGAVASLATWFVVVAALGALGGTSLDVQAATGLLAVVVLLVVMNWFFHRIYWTGWISSHNRRRRRLLVEVGPRIGAGSSSAWRSSASRASIARGSRSSCSSRACGCITARGSSRRARPSGSPPPSPSASRRSAWPGGSRTSGCSSSPACCSASCSS